MMNTEVNPITQLQQTSSQFSTTVLRRKEVRDKTGLSNTSLHERIHDKTMPPPFSLGGRSVGFFEHEVSAVLMARAAGQDDTQIKALVSLLVDKRKEFASSFIQRISA
ncbi:AlpA family phage regulatory protein [Alteromonas sp. IB21]|uniref:helix-turn-helix transcriptional regulator n=1 Tax=Alteromonas sp. IB21 TaxID=2779369 RepID=UPI0018E894E8|nr:AlpA family phage regulatory protein [Alteromonas sp. IB21]MBJ2128047.1 AlpA family phage regulatory protein [Alteromonas sp. IB21]